MRIRPMEMLWKWKRVTEWWGKSTEESAVFRACAGWDGQELGDESLSTAAVTSCARGSVG